MKRENGLFNTSLGARKPVLGNYKPQRHRPACASVLSDQHHCYLLIYYIGVLESIISKLATESP